MEAGELTEHKMGYWNELADGLVYAFCIAFTALLVVVAILLMFLAGNASHPFDDILYWASKAPPRLPPYVSHLWLSRSSRPRLTLGNSRAINASRMANSAWWILVIESQKSTTKVQYDTVNFCTAL